MTLTEAGKQSEPSPVGAKRRSWLSYLLTFVILGLIAAGGYAAYFVFLRVDNSTETHSRPTVAVTVVDAKRETWSSELSGVGTVTPVQGTDLTSELAGKVVAIEFESGARVNRDDLLVKLDTTSEVAQLESLEPQLRQARSDQKRAGELLESNAISEEAYEESLTEVDRLQAAIEEQRAIIARKKILAPFAGTLGIRIISLGQYISPGDAVTTLQQIQPIFVDFDLPEGSVGVVKVGLPVQVSTAAYPDETFRGEITAITPLIQQSTRSFSVRSELSNADRRLKPGMFAEVIVELPVQRDVVTVPQTAVAFNAYGSSLFVIDKAERETEQQQARRTFVRTGERRGLDIEIVAGIEAGQQVVTSGQLKLSDETPITISEQDASAGVSEEPTEP
ncbi:MAG: efflux RND transporter periplasmic adaptor subunit [Planctomycetaceae bacterium]